MERQVYSASSVEVEQIHPKFTTTKLIKINSTQNVDIPHINMLSVEEVLKSHILSLDMDNCEAESDNAFFVADLGEIYRQHLRWKTNLPRVEPFYGKLIIIFKVMLDFNLFFLILTKIYIFSFLTLFIVE
jgi:hypothetical protein